MKIPLTSWEIGKPAERRNFTDSIVAQAIAAAAGNTPELAARQTAAAQFGIGYYARAFASAIPQPDTPALTPHLLVGAARALMLYGEWLADIEVDGDGLRLVPAQAHDIAGGPDEREWRYALELAGPSHTETVYRPSEGVIHVRLNADVFAPWQGQSPLALAGLSAKAIANVELRLGQELASRTGYLLPTPELSEDQDAALRADLASLAGNMALITSKQQGTYASGNLQTATTEFAPRRFGANVPPSNLVARRELGYDVLGALGVPPQLLQADAPAGALREAYRVLLAGGIEPIGRLVSTELSRKLEREIKLSFRTMAAADIAGRARAWRSLAGRDAEFDGDAAEMAGLRD